MSSFPVGSKVIVTTPWAGETTYKNGEIYTVDYPEGPGVYVKIDGVRVYIASDEFEAYTEPFKVGDKVVVTATNEDWSYELGDTSTVDFIDSQEPKIRLKGAGYVYTSDLKLAPAKAEPTPSSHIKIIRSSYPSEYRVGDILEVQKRQDVCAGSIRVTNKEGGTSVPPRGDWEYYTEPVADTLPRTISFKDILKGDTIRAEYAQGAVKYIQEGAAATAKYEGWLSQTGSWVAAPHFPNATYTLLERPEPPKPNPFAEAKVGSIATYSEEGIKYLKTGENAWAPISRKGTLSGYRNSDKSMTNCGDLIQVTHNA